MATGTIKHAQHVVAVPIPAQGHLNPLMRFCHLLAQQPGFTITFVELDPVPSELQQVQQQGQVPQDPPTPAAPPSASAPLPPPLIRRARIPVRGGLLRLFHRDFSFTGFYAALRSIGPDLEHLILSLNHDGPRVTCLLSDFNITLPTQDVADKLGIPRIVLYPCCASRLLFSHYLTQGEHNISIQAVMEALAGEQTKRGEVFCKGLPGLPTIFSNHIPHYKHVTDGTLPLWETTVESWRVCNARAHGVVVNSFEDLEASTFSTLFKSCNVPIYDVGFWVDSLPKDKAPSLLKEDTTCMAWLDQQPPSSVLYISFGSTTLLSKSQFEEFQDGLICSQHRFLWVLRHDLVHGLDYSSCVATILSKSQGKGFVSSWAPQVQVLAHPSVAGFLTHCGWNSTTESFVNGVPMLCWPYFADQPLNAYLIVEVWKVGLGFKPSEEDSRFIERDEIEKVIRALMEGEEGRFVRQNATRLKEKSHECLLEHGSSGLKLKALVESLF